MIWIKERSHCSKKSILNRVYTQGSTGCIHRKPPSETGRGLWEDSKSGVIMVFLPRPWSAWWQGMRSVDAAQWTFMREENDTLRCQVLVGDPWWEVHSNASKVPSPPQPWFTWGTGHLYHSSTDTTIIAHSLGWASLVTETKCAPTPLWCCHSRAQALI